MQVGFELYKGQRITKRDPNYNGIVVKSDPDEHGDFTLVLASTGIYQEIPRDSQTVGIVILVRPNVSPVDEQLKATDQASMVTVFGDRAGNKGRGFSLKMTVLAHGREMDTHGPDYFERDMRRHSPLSTSDKESQIEHIRNHAKLDPVQLKAFTQSTTAIPGGLKIIQGPPGTGKTTPAVPIIISHAAIGLKVLIAAGGKRSLPCKASIRCC